MIDDILFCAVGYWTILSHASHVASCAILRDSYSNPMCVKNVYKNSWIYCLTHFIFLSVGLMYSCMHFSKAISLVWLAISRVRVDPIWKSTNFIYLFIWKTGNSYLTFCIGNFFNFRHRMAIIISPPPTFYFHIAAKENELSHILQLLCYRWCRT